MSIILYMTRKQRLPITDFMKKTYLAYFEVKVDDQDKKCAPHKVCGACGATLRTWSKGKNCYMKFEVPMVRREPRNYHADCYFCMVNTEALTPKQSMRQAIQGLHRAVSRQPQTPRSGGRGSQHGGPTFYFTTTALKVGIVDQC